MFSLSDLRANPFFAHLFAQVHALCWPILWWQLNRLCRWYKAAGVRNVLYSVNCWGFVTVHYIGDKLDDSTYTPPTRTFRPLTDASYASDLPANLADCETLTAIPILPRQAGEVAAQRPEGALTSPPNTS